MAFNEKGLHYYATFLLILEGLLKKVFETSLDNASHLAKAPEKDNHRI